MATDKPRCKRCGSNYTPNCAGCPWNSAEINQRAHLKAVAKSVEYARNQPYYRKNQTIAYACRTFDDAMFEEGTP